MKPFQKLKVVACFFIFISFSFGGHAFANSLDTLPPVNSYNQTGYRLSITSIKVDKSNSKSAKISYNLTNAGRNPVKLGKGRNIPKQLIFEFDNSLNEEGMFNHANAIATALREQKITLRAGQLLMNNKLKVNLNNSIADLVILRKEMKETNSESQLAEATPTEIQEEVIATEVITETVKEELLETDTEMTLPSTIVGNSIPENVDKIEEPKEVKNNESFTKMPPLVNTESIILIPTPSIPNLPEIEEVKIEEVVEEVAKEEVEEIETISEVVGTKTSEVVKEEMPRSEESIDEVTQPIVKDESINETDEFANAPHYEVDLDADVKGKDFLEEDICADLVMESVKIVKQSGKSVTLEYVIANYGNGSAALFGESKKDDDNVAIKAHLSKSRKLTRGSIPLKGTYISKGVKNKSGMLLPKERVVNTMKIDVSKMTKFTPVLVLSLDGFQDVEECDEFNNTVFINLIEVNKVAYAKPSRPKSDSKVLSKVEEEEK